MRLGEQLLLLMQCYADAISAPITTASKRATGTTNTVHRLRGGSGITDIRFDKAVRWFSENWPEHARWPSSVYRPHKKIAAHGSRTPPEAAEGTD